MDKMDIRAELMKIAEDIEKELEELDPDRINEYLDDRILEIRRIQSLVCGAWDTLEYVLLRTWGGPTVRVYSSGRIEAAWGNDYIEYVLSDRAKEALKQIENYLDDVLS